MCLSMEAMFSSFAPTKSHAMAAVKNYLILFLLYFNPCLASYHEQYRDYDCVDRSKEDKSQQSSKNSPFHRARDLPCNHPARRQVGRRVSTKAPAVARRRLFTSRGPIHKVFCQSTHSKIFCRPPSANARASALRSLVPLNAFEVPQASSPEWESYIFNNKEYIIQVLPVSWENAKILCRGYHNGSLAILNTKDKAEFLAEALSESQFSLTSVWVGARRDSAEDAAGYRWGPGMELRRTALDVLSDEEEENVERHYPMWLNRTHVPVPEMGADCVAVERVKHDQPVFLDLPCHLERAFACERDVRETDHVVEVNTIRCRGGLYRLYDGKMDWHQAAAYCVLRGMALANIASFKCLKKLGMTMLKNRPSIENAWVGAKGTLGRWTWIDTGVSLFQTPALLDAPPGIWPPMRDRNSIKQNGCLQLDRHASHPPVFLEARCERKMQFICYEDKYGVEYENGARRMASPFQLIPGETPSDDLYFYVLVRQLFYWQHANQNCLKMNGTLASLDNNDILIQLLLVMGENKEELIEHVWISGRLNMTKDISTDTVSFSWYNPNTGKRIPSPRSVEEPLPGTYVPPWWADEEFTMDNSCLNLDRQDHLIGLVYGLPCDTAQYSICMIEKPRKALPIIPEQKMPATVGVTEVPATITTPDIYESA